MKHWIISLFLFISLLVFLPKNIEATSGCCSWHGGVCGCNIGRQVCCDGTYSPSCGCYSPPIPTPIIFPYMTMTWQSNPNTDQTFNITVTLNDPSPSQYSTVVNKCAGCDPGPLADFYTNKFTFYNLKTGRYYLNARKEINGYWSNVSYWTLDIPEWSMPTSIPTPTLEPIALNNQNQPTNPENNFSIFISFLMLAVLGVILIYLAFKLLKWLIVFIKNNDWIWGFLIWGAIIAYFIISSAISSSNKSKVNGTNNSGYICNCAKTCPNLTCDEAYFQLNNCGCSVRDGDGDSIPCENVCN